MRKKNGAKRWPLGFGVLYLMVHVPFPLVWKIGITGVGVGRRAKSIDDAMPGFPVPVALVVAPGVFALEQFLHNLCHPIRCNFYRGSGHTEWFWFPCVVPALALISGIWAGYLWAIDAWLDTRLLPTVAGIVLDLLR